ncbi:MAG: hypothetical protein WBN07_02570 [Woeseiaceae bacterium]
MLKTLNSALSEDKIKEVVKQAREAQDEEASWLALAPLIKVQRHQREAAQALVRVVRGRYLGFERGLEVLVQLLDAHKKDSAMLAEIGSAAEGARDIDDLNSAPPIHPFFEDLVGRLEEQSVELRGQELEERTLDGLSTTARMLARQYDEVAENSYKRLVELDPDYSGNHYALGLFYKTRGHFREGVLANQRAVDLEAEPQEAYEWNLGICATGARQGSVALEVWKRMNQKIEMGRFDLPEGGYPQCKVRLAERPLAERNKDCDDPGLEETIWIQRLSPCHGVVRSVLFQDLGVDYGDVVLIDGAPITEHTYGESSVPVFPHLATLVQSGYQYFDFAGTQDDTGRLADCSVDLDTDAIVYSHTESFQILCASCWRNPDLDHQEHEEVERHVVTGRIAAPPQITAADLLSQLDRAVESRKPCKIYSPSLCEAAGQIDRARFEKRRFDMLQNNR